MKKEHKNVIADVRNMFEQLAVSRLSFSVSTKIALTLVAMFILPKDLTLTLVLVIIVKNAVNVSLTAGSIESKSQVTAVDPMQC